MRLSQAEYAHRRELLAQGMKYCPRCRETKGIVEFGKDKKAWAGISVYCLECRREQASARGAIARAKRAPESREQVLSRVRNTIREYFSSNGKVA